MSVYTQLNQNDISAIISEYSLGTLDTFSGISAGIENSNFFINTNNGRYVLTIFERMTADELPYFMNLMHHLATHGFTSPAVQRRHNGESLFVFVDDAGDIHHGCIVSCLAGRVLNDLSIMQLYSAGAALADLHQTGNDFPMRRDSPSDINWLQSRVTDVQAYVAQRYGDAAQRCLLDEMLTQQSLTHTNLPTGVIHGDYFRDNMLFEGERISGVIDFYYAHDAAYALDIAIALNALSIELPSVDTARPAALLAGYQSVRPLLDAEWEALPDFLCLSAMRFWVSRLYDSLYPREGAMITTLDPEEYHSKLVFHQTHRQLNNELRTIIKAQDNHQGDNRAL